MGIEVQKSSGLRVIRDPYQGCRRVRSIADDIIVGRLLHSGCFLFFSNSRDLKEMPTSSSRMSRFLNFRFEIVGKISDIETEEFRPRRNFCRFSLLRACVCVCTRFCYLCYVTFIYKKEIFVRYMKNNSCRSTPRDSNSRGADDRDRNYMIFLARIPPDLSLDSPDNRRSERR